VQNINCEVQKMVKHGVV